MKASELTVGLEVAVTTGNGRYERKTEKATHCKVVEEASGGYVRLELMEDAHNSLGARGWQAYKRENWKKKGDTISVKTRHVWMEWDQIKVRAENERRLKEERDTAEREKEERLAALQQRLDVFAGATDDALRWGGVVSNVEDYVRIPTQALDELLTAAER